MARTTRSGASRNMWWTRSRRLELLRRKLTMVERLSVTDSRTGTLSSRESATASDSACASIWSRDGRWTSSKSESWKGATEFTPEILAASRADSRHRANDLPVGAHFAAQPFAQRGDVLARGGERGQHAVHRRRLLHRQAARPARHPRVLQRPEAVHLQAPAPVGPQLERVEEAGRGPGVRAQRAAAPALEEDARAGAPLQRQPRRAASEVAVVQRAARLVGPPVLDAQPLHLREGARRAAGGVRDPVHVRPGERGELLAVLHLAAGAAQRARAAGAGVLGGEGRGGHGRIVPGAAASDSERSRRSRRSGSTRTTKVFSPVYVTWPGEPPFTLRTRFTGV